MHVKFETIVFLTDKTFVSKHIHINISNSANNISQNYFEIF